MLLLSSGCVAPYACDAVVKPAWRSVSSRATRGSCRYPGSDTWIELRYSETQVFANDRVLGTRVDEGSPAWDLMLDEARDRALLDGDEVLLAYELDPDVVVGNDHRNLTGLLLVRANFGGAVLLRGPFGWSREKSPDFEYALPSVPAQLAVAFGGGLLVGLAALADLALGASAVGIVAVVVWVYLGAPGAS